MSIAVARDETGGGWLNTAVGLSVSLIDDLLSCSDIELDRTIERALAAIGDFTSSDRVYVFRIRQDHFLDNTHEWVAQGIAPMKSMLQDMPMDVAAHWWKGFDDHGCIHIEDVDALAASRPERTILQQQQIKSLLAVPMRHNGAYAGFMGLDSVRQKRSYLDGEISLLKTMANVIASAIARRDANAMSELALIDQLTQVANRRYFDLAAERAQYKAARTGLLGALFFVDINDFKLVNDTHGHKAGDCVLEQIAKRLEDASRAEDFVARYGGDEFIVLIEGLGEDLTGAQVQAMGIANRLLDRLKQPMQIETGTTPLTVTPDLSLGVAIFGGNDRRLSNALLRADRAMYTAKANGASIALG